jgi:hypothetical protein
VKVKYLITNENVYSGLTAKTWSELNREVAEETKTTFREEFILKLIKQGPFSHSKDKESKSKKEKKNARVSFNAMNCLV